MDIIFNRAVVNKVQESTAQLEQMKAMANFEPEWSIIGPIGSMKVPAPVPMKNLSSSSGTIIQ